MLVGDRRCYSVGWQTLTQNSWSSADRHSDGGQRRSITGKKHWMPSTSEAQLPARAMIDISRRATCRPWFVNLLIGIELA